MKNINISAGAKNDPNIKMIKKAQEEGKLQNFEDILDVINED